MPEATAFRLLYETPAPRTGFTPEIVPDTKLREFTSPEVESDFDVDTAAGLPRVLVDSARRRARAEGWRVGYAEGQHAAEVAVEAELDAAGRARELAAGSARAEVEAVISSLHHAAEQLESTAMASMQQLADEIVDALSRLTGVVCGRVGRDADAVLELVREVLLDLPGRSPVTLSLNPVDAERVGGVLERADVALGGDDRPVSVLVDPTLRPGDVVARSGASTVDATMSAAVDRVVEALRS